MTARTTDSLMKSLMSLLVTGAAILLVALPAMLSPAA